MLTFNYKSYTVSIVNEPEYSENTVDNLRSYQWVYGADLIYSTHSHHGIWVQQTNQVIACAMLTGHAGGTTVHKHSALIKDDKLFVCCSDHIYALNLPDLTLCWKKQLDDATCFQLFDFKDDMIVHGELQITRIAPSGTIKWQFSARDIFVTQDDTEAFDIINDQICLKDWEGYEYVLDENGNEIPL